MKLPRAITPLLALLAFACGGISAADTKTAVAPRIEFNRDVRPILSDKCFKCHGPDAKARKAELRLDLREAALADHDGARPIVPHEADKSEVVRRIETDDADDVMPPKKSNLHLSKKEIAVLRQWIAEGAEYQPHWSLVAPKARISDFGFRISDLAKRDAGRAAELQHWPKNPIDHFVLDRLLAEGLTPSPEAAPATLIRRATLALTGLPPTPAELAAFEDESHASQGTDVTNGKDATYGRLVERLLASPRFGERMALDWLDAARYADTNGFYSDSERQAWPWRDWVIGAFNRNLTFNQFTIEQLAGDLLPPVVGSPEATTAQKIATGFNRNHMVTNESGIIEEEYRTGYVMDRVDTTATVWMGLTLGCARCHDHKYDPLTQRDYYQVFAAFNNIQESELVKDVAPLSPAPTLALPTAEQDGRLAAIGRERQQCEAKLRTFQPALEKEMAAWEMTALDALPAAPVKGSLVHFDFDADGADHGPKPVAATTSGKLVFEAGVKGKGATFDATQYIEFAAPQPLERDRAFTFAAWIMPGSAPQGCVASKMNSDADARGFEILWYKSQPRINLAHRYGHDGIEVVAQQKFGGKQWHHLAITYDGSSKAAGLKVYVDGALNPVGVRRDNLSGSVASNEPWRIAWKGTGIGFDGGMDEVRLFGRALAPEEIEALHWREFIGGAVATPRKERTRAQSDKLESYYIARHAPEEVKRLTEQAAALRGEEDTARRAILSASVMQEMDRPRETHILTRGQYDQPAEKVEFGVPASLGPLPKDAPRNRLGFAQWLVAPEHPLTARVEVNRLWQQCFGDGLVRTPNDFGLQGEAPSHPELLDWLAVRLRDGDGAAGTPLRAGGEISADKSVRATPPWDVKAMLRLIVTSATFRQSSNFTPALLARDPENRLLARGPRHRLPAEVLRDQALALGGLLVERIGGPSVKPSQPPGLWEAVSYNGDATYEADHGESLYRRGLYTYWKRQSPPPGTLTFDGPTREVCTVRRPRTNTPLQALVLLNDVTYVEAARGLATRMMRAKKERIAFGFRAATGRSPKNAEAAALQSYFDEQLAVFRAKPESARALLKSGESPADPALDACELAAWTMTASLLLNLDETITQH